MICYWYCHLYLSVSCSPYALLFTVGEHIANVCQPEVISELLSPKVILDIVARKIPFSHSSTLCIRVSQLDRILYKGSWLPKLVGEMSRSFCSNEMNMFIYRWNNWTYIYHSFDSVLILSSGTNKSFYLGQQCRY